MNKESGRPKILGEVQNVIGTEMLYKSVNELLSTVSSLAADGVHHDRHITDHKNRMDKLETQQNETEKKVISLQAFGRQIESLNSNVENLVGDVTRLVSRQKQHSMVFDGGVKITWLIISNLVMGIVTFAVSAVVFGVNGT